MRTRIKICGITHPTQAHWAVSAGADAIGLVFYPPSKRVVSVDLAKGIAAKAAPLVSVVGVFADQPQVDVERIVSSVRLDLLQFHGDEPETYCMSFDRPYLKGIRMRPGINIEDVFSAYATARGFLVDTYKSGTMGGTGSSFDWDELKNIDRSQLILAGGLNPENVANAVRVVRPAAVDVSTGVEVSVGHKDPALINAFVAAVEG